VKGLSRTVGVAGPACLAALVVVSAAVFVGPAPKASAFDWVVSTSPPQGGVVNSPPATVTTTMGAPVADATETVTGPDGKTWSTGDTIGDGNIVDVAMMAGPEPTPSPGRSPRPTVTC
jgi:methionine-rich copper-binding protein CopC